MKKQTINTNFDDYLEAKLTDPEFAELYRRERLINEAAVLVHDLRKKAKLSQHELSLKANTKQPVIARLERGLDKRIPSLDLLDRIARAAGKQLHISFK